MIYLDDILLELMKFLGIALSASLASGGIIMHFIKKHDRVADLERKFDRLSEGIELSLEDDIVIFKALRQGHINGESEAQESKLNDFFRKSIELLNEGGKYNEKH